jgi:hypothetical protein
MSQDNCPFLFFGSVLLHRIEHGSLKFSSEDLCDRCNAKLDRVFADLAAEFDQVLDEIEDQPNHC